MKRLHENTNRRKQSANELDISWPKNKLLLCFDVDLSTQFGFNLQIGWPRWMDMGYRNVPTTLKKKCTDER